MSNGKWVKGLPDKDHEGLYWILPLCRFGSDEPLRPGPVVGCQVFYLNNGTVELYSVVDPHSGANTNYAAYPWREWYHWSVPIEAPDAVVRWVDDELVGVSPS